MTNKIRTFRRPARLTCTWIATGDRRAPLACVWSKDGTLAKLEAIATTEAEPAGQRLCA